MARYVVVEFARNADAQAFIEQIHEDTEKGLLRRVVGAFVKPGKVCECYKWEVRNYGDKNEPFGISRGEKFGWWVCDNCHKPRRAGHQLVNQLLASQNYADITLPEDQEFEFVVDGLYIGGIYLKNIDRPKNLQLKKARKAWRAASSS